MNTAILSTPVTLVPPTVQTMIDEARRDPQAFWDRAGRELPWFREWDRVFDSSEAPGAGLNQPEFQPAFRWFAGGRTNLCYNALDHHVAHGRGDHTALIYFNERGEQRRFTYRRLLQEVERVAAALDQVREQRARHRALGAFVASRRRGNPIGWLLWAQGFILLVAIIAEGYALRSELVAPLPGATGFALIAHVIGGPIFFAPFIAIFLLFPTGRLKSPRWRWVVRLAVLSGGLTAAAFLF